MLKQFKVAVSILAMSAVLLAPAAKAAEPAAAEQTDENCIAEILEFFGMDAAQNPMRKNGFEAQDGKLYHYTAD